MDNNQYNPENNAQNNEQSTREHYRYALQRPEEALWTPGSAPVVTGTKKKKKSGGRVIAFVLAALLLVGGGGAGGYAINEWLQPQEVQVHGDADDTEALDPGSAQDPDDSLSADASSEVPSYTPVNAEKRAMIPSEIYAQCNAAVVAISTETTGTNIFGQPSSGASAGSGFLISEDGMVITNHHVIDGANSIKVLMADGSTYDAKVIGSDAVVDIAVLQLQDVSEKLPYLKLGDSDAISVGDMVVAIGNPLGELANTLTVGYISGKEREVNIEGTPMVMLQTDAAISPGNSGGPLINVYGEVIGIISAKSMDNGAEGIGFAIPANSADSDIDDLIANGYIKGRPNMGIGIDSNYTSYARQYRQPYGAYIASVDPGSCSEKAGLKEGDIITAIDEHSVESFEDLQAAKNRYKAGDTVTVTYLRDGKESTTKLTFDESPSANNADTSTRGR